MILYGYGEDGVYTCPTAAKLSPARPKNVDGTWNYIRPARTTDAPPPDTKENESPVWTGSGWNVTPDFRGQTVYAVDTGEAMRVTTLGAIPSGYTLQPSPGDSYSWNQEVGGWVLDIEKYRAAACVTVDSSAESLRNTVVSPGSAQAMTYIDKERQAIAYLAATDPIDDDYPNLVAEVGINGATVKDVSETIVRNATAWRAWNATVENIRLSAKKQINESDYTIVIDGIVSSIVWPSAPGVV